MTKVCPIKNALGEAIYPVTHAKAVTYKDGNVEGYLDDVGITIGKYINKNFSNSNLLINGDFQIWQRGTSFTTAGYTADRWVVSGSGITVKKENNTLKLVTTTTDANLTQHIESNLQGIKLSASVIYLKNNKLTTWTKTLVCTNVSNLEPHSIDDTGVSLYVFYDNNRNATSFHLNTQKNTTILFNFLKLEFGEVATICMPRLYAEELTLCKRYYQTIGNYQIYLCRYHFNAMFSLVFEEMRIAPTVTITGADGFSTDVFVNAVVSSTTNTLHFNYTFSTSIFNIAARCLFEKVVLDAEIR